MYEVTYYAKEGCDEEINLYYASDLFAWRKNLDEYEYLGKFSSLVDAMDEARKRHPGKSVYLCHG